MEIKHDGRMRKYKIGSKEYHNEKKNKKLFVSSETFK